MYGGNAPATVTAANSLSRTSTTKPCCNNTSLEW